MATTTSRQMVLNQTAAGMKAHDVLREHITNVTRTTALAMMSAINEHEVAVAMNELLRAELMTVIEREKAVSEKESNGGSQVITHNGQPMTFEGVPVTISDVQQVEAKQPTPTIPATVAPPADPYVAYDARNEPRVVSGANILVELQDSIDTIVRALGGIQAKLNQVRADIAADRIILR